MSASKISISLPKEELAAAKRAAAKEGITLSALVARLIRANDERLRQLDAMEAFLKKYAPHHRLTEKARAAIEAEWYAPLKPVRPRRRRRAA